MAWNAALPADDGLLINAPGQIRANWDALALMTDSSLLITNAKCAAAMGLVDSKLAQITSSSKVSGTALTSLGSIPSGAGTIPLANIPSTLTGKDADTLDGQEGSYYLDMDNPDAGSLAVARGGTNSDFSATAQGNLLYFSALGVISALGPGVSGQFLKTLGAGANPAWTTLSTLLSYEIFTENGTFTAPAGVNYVWLYMLGGGAGGITGGGSGGGGGGAGGAVEGLMYPVTPLSEYTVVVGVLGASQTNGNPSSFDTIIVAPGGSAGSGGTGGVGAVAVDVAAASGMTGKTIQTISHAGGDGSDAIGSGGLDGGGGGAPRFIGAGADGGGDGGNPGDAAAANSGGGGGGGGASGGTGGTGGSGVVIVVY